MALQLKLEKARSCDVIYAAAPSLRATAVKLLAEALRLPSSSMHVPRKCQCYQLQLQPVMSVPPLPPPGRLRQLQAEAGCDPFHPKQLQSGAAAGP